MRGIPTILSALVVTPALVLGAWLPTEDISSNSESPPYLSGDSIGHAIAVCVKTIHGEDRVVASFHTEEGGWSPSTYLSGVGYNSSAPKVSCNTQGQAVAVWTNEATDQLEFSTTKNILLSFLPLRISFPGSGQQRSLSQLLALAFMGMQS